MCESGRVGGSASAWTKRPPASEEAAASIAVDWIMVAIDRWATTPTNSLSLAIGARAASMREIKEGHAALALDRRKLEDALSRGREDDKSENSDYRCVRQPERRRRQERSRAP